MGSKLGSSVTEQVNYSEEFQPEKAVKVIKKDGSLEAFNVQKVIDAVGKVLTVRLQSLPKKNKSISARLLWIK